MEKLIHIDSDSVSLEGMLKIPPSCGGLILFAHGSGSSRFSPRNNFVADILYKGGLATLLIDLLSKEEDMDYQMRFDIALLSQRLQSVVKWLRQHKKTKGLALGLFGSSTGAAAALETAAALPEQIRSVVSRGGRPDLAMSSLAQVRAPTLLIVGGDDTTVLELNEEAFAELQYEKELEIIPNATHLFEEPGCLEEVARLSREWFKKTLAPA